MPNEADFTRLVQATFSHGETRLFRRHIGLFWRGEVVSKNGNTVTLRNAYAIDMGVDGMADLDGITAGGKHVSIETKLIGKRTQSDRLASQMRWCAMIRRLGGLAGFAYSLEDAAAILAGDYAALKHNPD